VYYSGTRNIVILWTLVDNFLISPQLVGETSFACKKNLLLAKDDFVLSLLLIEEGLYSFLEFSQQ
jgi:hypothetical protein